ncbi:hypothetical protein RYB67_18190 [Pseudomonas syringae]|nr:hypothetical protein [Pseudomonas syringae]
MGHQKQKKNQPMMDVATVDDFKYHNLPSIFFITNILHFHTLQEIFQRTAHVAKELGDAAAGRAHSVLSVTCSYHFNPSRTGTFGPQMIMDRRSSLIPSDYIGQQQDDLMQVTDYIDHPLLSARVTDSCWYTNRKLHRVTKTAPTSYLDAVNLFFTGGLLYQYESDFEVLPKEK